MYILEYTITSGAMRSQTRKGRVSISIINEIGGAHWCTLCTLSRSMGMVYTVCTAGLHAPQI